MRPSLQSKEIEDDTVAIPALVKRAIRERLLFDQSQTATTRLAPAHTGQSEILTSFQLQRSEESHGSKATD